MNLISISKIAMLFGIGLLLVACRGPSQQRHSYQQTTQDLQTQFENERLARVAGVKSQNEVEIATFKDQKIPTNYKKLIDRELADVLKDPDSRKVKFGAQPQGSLVCGLVNAKNSYGGYTGDEPFYAYFIGGKLVKMKLFSSSELDDAWKLRNGGFGGDIFNYEIMEKCGISR